MTYESCIVQKFQELSPLSDEEQRLLSDLEKDIREYPAGHTLRAAGQRNPPFFTLQSGWACSVRLLPNGQRQILEIFIGSQIMGLSETGAEYAQTELMALTKIKACPFSARALQQLLNQSAKIAQLIIIIMARDQALLVERVMSIGKRRGAERLAHFLLEIRFRTQSASDLINLPFNQTIIGDALGMSSVHVSRSFGELRKQGLIEMQGKEIQIPNIEALAGYCSFCPRYLASGATELASADPISRWDSQLLLANGET